MSLKILGNDFKKIHDLITKIKEETGERRIFTDYVNSYQSNGIISDPLTDKEIFFDDMIYETNLDRTVHNIDPNETAQGWDKAETFTKYMKQIHKILAETKNNQKKLKFDKKARIKFIVDWYKQLIDKMEQYKSPIWFPYWEKETYDKFVSNYFQEIPWIRDGQSTINEDFIKDYIFDPKDEELIIRAYGIKTKNKMKSYMYHANPKDMIDILIITSYCTESMRLLHNINFKFDNFLKSCTDDKNFEDILYKKLNDFQAKNEYKIWKLWFLIKTQAPKDKAVLQIKQWVQECVDGNKDDNIGKFYPKWQFEMTEGLRNFIGNIMTNEKEFIKKWQEESKKDAKDNDNKKILKWLSLAQKEAK